MDKLDLLKQYFGHESFRGGQENVIDALLAGRDALAIMPTGGGKSPPCRRCFSSFYRNRK